jgi:PAS domain-containing protein
MPPASAPPRHTLSFRPRRPSCTARAIELGGDAVVRPDNDWRYMDVNGPAEGMIGRTATELVGRRVLEAFPGTEDTAFWPAYQREARRFLFASGVGSIQGEERTT